MPEKRHSIDSIDVRKAKAQAVIEGEGGHHKVTPADEQEARIKGAGFQVNWDGQVMVADKEARNLYDKFQADPDSFEVKETEDEKEITHTETGESATFKPEVVFGPDNRPAEEPAPEPVAEESEEEGVKYLAEDEFLKAHGLYSNYIRSIDDVDRDIQYHRKRLQDHDGYVGNEILFTDDAVATPEAKVETLKTLRSVSAQAVREYREGARLRPEDRPPEKEERKAPPTPIERLSEDERESLGNPLSEGYAKALDKYVTYKAEERIGPLQKRLDRLEWEQSSNERELTQDQAKRVVTEYPELRLILSNPKVSMARKATILAQMGLSLEDAREASYNAGRSDQIKLETKRKAQLRLAPTRPSQRTASSPSDQKVKEMMAKIAELRRQRKSGSRVKVAPEIAKVIQQLG